MIGQIEGATVLVLNGTDKAAGHVDEVEQILTILNPRARIVRACAGQVGLEHLVKTGLFRRADPGSTAGWTLSMRNEYPATAVPGCGAVHVHFQTRRPFHPTRLDTFLEHAWQAGGCLHSVLRSKGLVWLATQPLCHGDWAQTGDVFHLVPGQVWYAVMHADYWPANRAAVRAMFDANPEIGDRRQDLVFLGRHLDAARITSELTACLLTDAEWVKGQATWSTYEDPFGHWIADLLQDHNVQDMLNEDGDGSSDSDDSSELELTVMRRLSLRT